MAFYHYSMTKITIHTQLVAIKIIFSNKITMVNKKVVKRNSPSNNSSSMYYNEYGSFSVVSTEEVSICIFYPGSMERFRGAAGFFFGLASVAEFEVGQFFLGIIASVGPASALVALN